MLGDRLPMGPTGEEAPALGRGGTKEVTGEIRKSPER
jgi:hypothetical protein